MGSSARFNVYAALDGLGPLSVDADAPHKFHAAAGRARFVASQQERERERRADAFLLEVREGRAVLSRVHADLAFSKTVEGEEEAVSRTVGLFKRARLDAAERSSADSLECAVGREGSASEPPDEEDELFAPLRAAPPAEEPSEKRAAPDELAEALQANLRRLHPTEDSPDDSEEVSDID